MPEDAQTLPSNVLEPDLVWHDGALRAGMQVDVSSDGRVAAVRPSEGRATRRLAGAALFPGFVNAHSHGFQRGLRGAEAAQDAAARRDFWGWREAMYALANRLTADAFERLTKVAFLEMRRAGITTVGEFHYLRHAADQDYALDRRVSSAASGAGIRLVLLPAYYRTGDVGEPLGPSQQRFATPDVEAYWRAFEAIESALDPASQTVGAACHSIRAAAPTEAAELYREARLRGRVFHMHVAEQRREVAASASAYGAEPLAVLLEALGSADGFTAVHATHSASQDLAQLASQAGVACICPLTEGNLGDGLPDLVPAAANAPLGHGPAEGSLALGTDCNARICMVEEMRWLEYGQRLRHERRGVLGPPGRASSLLEAATRGGARSLGVTAGKIAPGLWADFIVVDLDHPSLAGISPDGIADGWVFGSGNGPIAGTFVGGRFASTEDITEGLRSLQRA